MKMPSIVEENKVAFLLILVILLAAAFTIYGGVSKSEEDKKE